MGCKIVYMISGKYKIGPEAPEIVNAVVEIPKGSRNKYEYDFEAGVMKLDRVLASSTVYPADYGFVPETLSDDGDTLDVLILITEPTFPGCVVRMRPVGMLHMVDDKGGDDKIVGVADDDPRMANVRDISDLDEHTKNEIAHFFEVYKQLENKEVKTNGWSGKTVALEKIKTAMKNI